MKHDAILEHSDVLNQYFEEQEDISFRFCIKILLKKIFSGK